MKSRIRKITVLYKEEVNEFSVIKEKINDINTKVAEQVTENEKEAKVREVNTSPWKLPIHRALIIFNAR